MGAPRLRWVVFFACITFLIAIILTSFFMEISKVSELGGVLDKRMEDLVRAERKNQDLKQKIQYYSTPEGIARLAREHFDLVQSDEKMYRIEIDSQDKVQ